MNHFAVHLKLALHCKLYIFQILFPYRLLQDIEYSSLCSRVLVYLFLYTSVYMLIPNSYLSPAPGPTIPFGSPKFVFYAFLCLGICFCSVIFFFYISHMISCDSCLSSVNMTISRSIYAAADGIISSLWFKNIPLYTCTMSSLSVHLSVDI